MLKRAEPPICVGLYARWGSGKTFMISLLKKEFDPSVYEDPHTHQLLQFFEKGYKKQEPKQAEHTVKALVYSLLVTILLTFLPPVPYGVATFLSIICDAFDPRDAFRAAGAWCSRLRRSCSKKGKTTDYVAIAANRDGGKGSCCMAGLCQRLTGGVLDDQERSKTEMKVQNEFIFVDFNAWECAAFASTSLYRLYIAHFVDSAF